MSNEEQREEGQFDQLLTDLDALSKAQSADGNGAITGEDDGDEKIAAAAGDDGADIDPDAVVGKDDDDKDDDDDDDESFGKSFTAVTADGNEEEFIDATSMLKSLQMKVGSLRKSADADREALGKALTLATEMLEEQGKVISSLGEQVIRLSNSGQGRKSVVSADPKLVKSHVDQVVTSDELLSKCLDAQKEGRLSGLDVSIAEANVLRGLPVPDHIVARLK